MITILKAGYSQKLRHMPRAHRVNVASISERLAVSNVHIAYCHTKEQRANGFTKVITPQEWPAMLEQLCLSDGPASTMISAALSQQVATEPLESSDPESVAGILPRRLQEQHILQLFHLLPSDELSRPVALTEGRSFTTGAYANGDGMVGLRRNTTKFRGVTSVLARFVRQQKKGLLFTEVAICQGTHSVLHSENHNEADSYSLVVPITKVEGGQMWIEDVEGHSQCPDATCNLAKLSMNFQ